MKSFSIKSYKLPKNSLTTKFTLVVIYFNYAIIILCRHNSAIIISHLHKISCHNFARYCDD